jgi:small-conductance mechanosensitive channel
MFVKFLNNQFYGNLLDTIVIFIVICIIYSLFRFFLIRRISGTKSKKKAVARLNYISFLFFIVFLAKIWITGFTHLFYALSLVSAGLVVTNKETIMNFVGGIVITWRGLFAEGDYIKIGDNAGFIYELGILYFKILQGSSYSANNISGKMVKIPNGLVITNAIVNFSVNSNLIETTQAWIITRDSDVKLAINLLQKQTEIVLDEYYKDHEKYNLKKVSQTIAKKLNLNVNIKVELSFDKPAGVKLTICYYCFPRDKDILDKTLLLSIYRMLNQQEAVKIAFAT